VLDFTNVQSQRQIDLEGPIDGVVTLCKRTFDASDILTYIFGNRILKLQIDVPRVLRKKSQHFFLNIQINDTGCTIYSFPVPIPGGGDYDFSPIVRDNVQFVRTYTNYGQQDCNIISFGPFEPQSTSCVSDTTLFLYIESPTVPSFTFYIENVGSYGECIWSVVSRSSSCTQVACTLEITYPGGSQQVTVSSTGGNGSFSFLK
jgi:hypothetical protein